MMIPLRNAALLAILVSLLSSNSKVAADAWTSFTVVQPNVLPAGTWGDEFGYAVGMSKDGTIAVSSAPQDGPPTNGGFYAYSRAANGTWERKTNLITGSGVIGTSSSQGLGLALSGNGKWVAIGGPDDGSRDGAVWVFKRTGDTWAQDGLLRETGDRTEGKLGEHVAISSAGSTVAASRAGQTNGGVVIFVNQNGWVQQGPRLVGTDTVATQVSKGYGLALTDNGNKVFFTSYNSQETTNGAWVFSRNTSNAWNQVGGKLTAAASVQGFGASLAISGDGSILAVGGGPYYVIVFAEGPDGNYSIVQTIPNPNFSGAPVFIALAMSRAGDRLLLGDVAAPTKEYEHNNKDIGSVVLLTRDPSGPVGSWTQLGAHITPPANETKYRSNSITGFGWAIGMDENGTHFIGGAFANDDYTGAAWFFESIPSSSPTPAPTPATTAPTKHPTGSATKHGGWGLHTLLLLNAMVLLSLLE